MSQIIIEMVRCYVNKHISSLSLASHVSVIDAYKRAGIECRDINTIRAVVENTIARRANLRSSCAREVRNMQGEDWLNRMDISPPSVRVMMSW